MKKVFAITGALVLAAVIGLGLTGGFSPLHSWAMGPGMMGGGMGGAWNNGGWGRGGGAVCGGWGAQNGGGYAPDQRAGKGAVSQEQAKAIVSDFVARRNPDLKVGRVIDAGGYYEVEILWPDGKLFDRLAVDKSSGLIRPLS